MLRLYVYDLPASLHGGMRPGAGKKPYEKYELGYEQYATEALIPTMVRRSKHFETNPEKAHFFIVPFPGIARYTKHKKSSTTYNKTNDEYHAALSWIRRSKWFDRYGGRDHIWIFASGRGASIFPDWKSCIGASIFLTPEGDKRKHYVRPNDKDIIIPGFRNVSRLPRDVLTRVSRESGNFVRPTFVFFRGSLTSDRPGEEDFSEGVRLTLERAVQAFRMPRHMSFQRELSNALVATKEKRNRIIFSSTRVPSAQYAREMSLSDFCISPAGSTSWTLRLYDALIVGCIPVIISDHVTLPWSSRIDWRKLVIKWPQAEVATLFSFLISFSQRDIQTMRTNILAHQHNFVWGDRGSAFEQLIEDLYDLKSRNLRYALRVHQSLESPSFWGKKGSDQIIRRVHRCLLRRKYSEYNESAAQDYDVVLFISKESCVMRAAIAALGRYLRPRKIHIVLDSCTNLKAIQGAHNVQCHVFSTLFPTFSAESARAYLHEIAKNVPPSRRGWYYQQIVKMAIALFSPHVSETLYMWDGDTVALKDFPLALDAKGRFPLLIGDTLDSPAYFVRTGSSSASIPTGYIASTMKLTGIHPPTDRSFVTQWQVWNRKILEGLVGHIENFTKMWWPHAILHAIPDDALHSGFSEYTLYGTWMLGKHASSVRLITSKRMPWLRDPPFGLLDVDGACCPSLDIMCQLGASFYFVSWECSHKSELRSIGNVPASTHARRSLVQLSPAPSIPPSASLCEDPSISELVGAFHATCMPSPSAPRPPWIPTTICPNGERIAELEGRDDLRQHGGRAACRSICGDVGSRHCRDDAEISTCNSSYFFNSKGELYLCSTSKKPGRQCNGKKKALCVLHTPSPSLPAPHLPLAPPFAPPSAPPCAPPSAPAFAPPPLDPPSMPSCADLNRLTNLRLSPKWGQWCNSRLDRRRTPAKCEQFYIAAPGAVPRLCLHDPIQVKCRLSQETIKCRDV